MSAEHTPIYREPRRVRPPYEQRDDSFDHMTPTEACRVAVRLGRVAALREPLAGLDVSEPSRRRILKVDTAWPWAEVITTAHDRLMTLPAP